MDSGIACWLVSVHAQPEDLRLAPAYAVWQAREIETRRRNAMRMQEYYRRRATTGTEHGS